jgi:hypothetical protein
MQMAVNGGCPNLSTPGSVPTCRRQARAFCLPCSGTGPAARDRRDHPTQIHRRDRGGASVVPDRVTSITSATRVVSQRRDNDGASGETYLRGGKTPDSKIVRSILRFNAGFSSGMQAQLVAGPGAMSHRP